MKEKKKLNVSKESLSIVICLVVIAFCSALLLSVVYKFTKVDEAAMLREEIGKQYSSPIASEIDLNGYNDAPNTEVLNYFKAEDGASVIVSKSNKAYDSATGITLIVIIKDEKVEKVVGYAAAETPGLGAKALKEKHLSQYSGIAVDLFAVETVSGGSAIVPAEGEGANTFKYTKVTGASISSNGVNLAVEAAIRAYLILGGNA